MADELSRAATWSRSVWARGPARSSCWWSGRARNTCSRWPATRSTTIGSRTKAEVLQKLRHTRISIEHLIPWRSATASGLLMRRGPEASRPWPAPRKEGRLHIDLLQRFGEDLLDVVNHLEEQGIPHRDIKPDNIAVGKVGRGDKLHVVLFDFSLSRTPAENIRAGTTGYMEPFLAQRKPPRWDLHAERFAAAMTLLRAGDRLTAPVGRRQERSAHCCPCEITDRRRGFDASLRDGLTGFFRRPSAAIRSSGSTMPRRCSRPGGSASRTSSNRGRFPTRPRNGRNSASCWRPRPTTRRSPSWGWARGPPTPWTGPTSSRFETCYIQAATTLPAARRGE